jgi:superfamily I DNA/RNA helicase
LRRITRTTFTRQAANLWKVKQELWQMLAQHIPHAPYLSIIDSFPVPVCRFARATYSRSFRDVATYGYDEVARHIYYGLRAHVRLAWPGVLVDCALAPAHLSDTKEQKIYCRELLALSWQIAITGHQNCLNA